MIKRRTELGRTVLALGLLLNSTSYSIEGQQGLNTATKELLQATKRREALNIYLALMAGASIDQESNGYTPLMGAVESANDGLVQLLIEHGAHINYANIMGNTALRLAVNGGLTNIAQLLIEHGADINAIDHLGYTPLMLSLINLIRLSLEKKQLTQELATLRLLIEHGARLPGEEYYQIVADTFPSIAQELSPEAIMARVLNKALEGNRLAYAAARGDRKRIAELLSTLPPEVRAENIALQQAAQAGSLSLLQKIQAHFKGLLNSFFTPAQQAKFLNINHQDTQGMTALHWAAAQGHADIVRDLLNAGANFRLVNNGGLTAFQLAQRNRREGTMRDDIAMVRRYQGVTELLHNYENIPAAREALQRAFRELPRPETLQHYAGFNPDEIIKHIIEYQLRSPAAIDTTSK